MPGSTHGTSGSERARSARRLLPRGDGNPALDRLAELAARLLGSSSAQVTVLSDVQTIAAGSGLSPHAIGSESPLGDSLCTVTVAEGDALVVVDAARDSRVAALPPVTSGTVGSYLGVPLVADDGQSIGALCVFDQRPRKWSTADIALLQQLAAPVVAELELGALTADYQASQVIWELAIDAAGVGAFDWNLVTGELSWDDRLLELFGLDDERFGGTIEAFNQAVHPDDVARVTQALRGAIETGGEFAAEYRALLPGGEVRWISARGRALPDRSGEAVRVIGAAFDTTAVQDGEARIARLLEAMPTAFFSLDPQWRFTYVNSEAERLLGSPRTDLVGGSIWDLFPDAGGSDFETHYRRAMDSGRPESFDAYYPAPLDAWYEVRAWPSTDGLSVYFVDITARRAAQEAIERTARRSTLLARLTAELTGTLDTEEAVGRLATLVVPDLADWCVVTLVEDAPHPDWRRRLSDIGTGHFDPEMQPVLERYAELRIPALSEDSFVAQVLRTARSAVIHKDATGAIGAALESEEARALNRRLAPSSAALVPLPGRGRTVGLLTVFRGEARPSFSAGDLETLDEVAIRAGLALDNAQLFARQRELAEVLQRSMLTPPPEPDHLEVKVRYEPAAHAAQVGGDWYDSFLQRDGTIVVVIGDVVGHDSAAAAAMGQVRSLLRGIAVHTGDGPSDVLCGVDQVMQTLQADTTATAVVARLEQTPDERAHGTTRLRWANAGHPPPMVIDRSGAVHVLGSDDPDLLLGLDPATDRREHVHSFARGATVLLYTDGLVERRGQSLDQGLDELRQALGDLARSDLSLDELCDQVLARMLPARRDDDVALVAVRLHVEE